MIWLNIVFVALVVLAFHLIYKIVVYVHRIRILRRIPGPKPLPIIGNILDYHGPPEKIFQTLLRYNKEYAPIYKVVSGHITGIFVSSPEDIEIIISGVSNLEKHIVYDVLHCWLQRGLLTSTEEKWHSRRKLLTPTFHFNILRQFALTFIENTEKTLKEIEELTNETVDVTYLAMKYTFQTICETAMGTNIDTSSLDRYRNAVLKMGTLTIHRTVRPWLYPTVPYLFSPKCYEGFVTSSLLHKYSRNIIKRRKDTFNVESVSSNMVNDINDEDFVYKTKNKRRLAMLDMLLYAKIMGENIDEEGIREEVDTFVFEGHDTTSSCLSFALMLLACNKDVQDRVVEEMRQVLPNKADKVTFDKVNEMKYLERVIKETLRLYPSVPMFGRCTGETILTHTGYVLPPKTNVLIRTFDLHRNADIYPDPEKFDPDRFLPEMIKERHPFAYIPFSAGPRNCIGQKFALLEMKIFLSGILRNFELLPIDTPETIVLVADLILHTKNGIRLKFVPRSL